MSEALRHWKGGFGKISAKAFFRTVDMDGNGEIEYDEFLRFWKVVKDCGHSEEEIIEELQRIQKGESWVGFNNLPKQFGLARTVTHKVSKKLPSIEDEDEEKQQSEAEEENDEAGGIRFDSQPKKMGEGLNLLTAEAIEHVQAAFDSFDIDHSDAIDLEECLRHWGRKGFGRISAKAFLRTVDMDGNGEIEFDEFLRFW
jgi:Ca2+-binding EF-hand superfamily protein